MLTRHFEHPIALGLAGLMSGGVVRSIEHQEARAGEQAGETLEVQLPCALAGNQGPARDITTNASGHLHQGLIARGLYHHAISALENRVHGQENGLFGSIGHQDMAGLAMGIEAGDLLAKRGIAAGLGVAQPELQEEGGVLAGELEHIADAQ